MTSRTRNILGGAFALLLAGSFAQQAKATFVSYSPSPADLNDLDHHMVYTWRIDNINLNGGTIAGATLTFKNIANWDNTANILHMWLLDTAKNAGVASFVDDPTNSSPVTDMTDDFLNDRYHGRSNWLVAPNTKQLFLANKSFTTNPVNYTITFNATQLNTLRDYIANGKNVAFGIDPDCHFFNDGLVFTLNITPVPEMNALFPIIGLVTAVSATQILRRRRLARSAGRVS